MDLINQQLVQCIWSELRRSYELRPSGQITQEFERIFRNRLQQSFRCSVDVRVSYQLSQGRGYGGDRRTVVSARVSIFGIGECVLGEVIDDRRERYEMVANMQIPYFVDQKPKKCLNCDVMVTIAARCERCASRLIGVNVLIAILTKIGEAVAWRGAFVGSFGRAVRMKTSPGAPTRYAEWCNLHGPQVRGEGFPRCSPCSILDEKRKTAIAKLVEILLLCGHALWESVDDSVKRWMMLDMEPAAVVVIDVGPIAPIQVELREVPIPVKPWSPPKPLILRPRLEKVVVYEPEERMELLELYDAPTERTA